MTQEKIISRKEYTLYLCAYLYEAANDLASNNHPDKATILHNIRNRLINGIKLTKKQSHTLRLVELSLARQLKKALEPSTEGSDSTQTEAVLSALPSDTNVSPQG